MDEFELKRIIYDYVKEICHYSQMQVFATSSYQRNYFQLQIDDTINGLINLLLERDEMAMQQNSLASQVEWIQQRDQEMQSGWEYPVFGVSQEQSQEEASQAMTEELQVEGEASQGEASQGEASQAEASQAEASQGETSQGETSKGIESQGEGASQVEAGKPRIITLEELKEADGSAGKKAYVAVNGNVYDVSVASRWGGGTHFGLFAGKDHTSEFIACHNSMFEILKILPIIGVLQK